MGHANGYPEESGIHGDLQERISKSVVPLANAFFESRSVRERLWIAERLTRTHFGICSVFSEL